MSNTLINTKKTYQSSIRQVDMDGLITGGEKALAFMHSELQNEVKPLIAIEVLANLPKGYSSMLKDNCGDSTDNLVDWAKKAVNTDADILAVRFNLTEDGDIEEKIAKSQKQIEEITSIIDIPVFILGSDKRDLDQKLLPALAAVAKKPCTVGVVIEDNYKEIIPSLIQYGHNVIIRTPIDINLAKQLNILVTEMGFDANKLIIDPNIGGLGYGLDYAYSVIERIKLAALDGDNMLNMPIAVFVGEEAWKTKEAKSLEHTAGWGEAKTRAISWECLTASSLLVAGANIAVMYHPESIKYIKNFINQA